ncbi:pyridine nucleotide-disulfide oxidoreductase [Pontibacillus halophilus JSM 076056 = DSM 19796]|uniref:Pyridine nucleotide-disulfide oxidoreductase n=1 Tax=Pontibacillus halophilus JSM 076056 = DSM 19796 TaxID=1385510 RepID=A0A0A5GLB5_9BACI|nr:FAD-dependent oxidoreductase [Pontibacillus halophilus]KGX91988.1 pyridine nucleotide-disulfide oxidoreductase [Pontibacillus halophilus JSM 076056 = DSM 19796]
MKKLLLVGAGHAHLHIIKEFEQAPYEDLEVTLLSPSRYQYYSGMFSGYTEGVYKEEEIRVDIEALSERTGVKWYKEAVVSVDAVQKIALSDTGSLHEYDAVSFDIGSLTAHTSVKGVQQHALRIKPNYHFPDALERLQQSKAPVVIGGGAAGTEIALNLQAYRMKHNIQKPVQLLSSSDRLLPSQTEQVSAHIEKIVEHAGIELHLGEKVTEMNSMKVYTNTQAYPYKDALWLAGPRAPELFRLSKLPTDDQNYLLVESTLQVKDHPSVFGAGDCISLRDYPDLEKNGVFAVRQAPVLWKNILGFLYEKDGEHFIPQTRYLSILSTGDQKGFLMYGKWHLHTGWAWKLKHRIDSKFIARYQD